MGLNFGDQNNLSWSGGNSEILILQFPNSNNSISAPRELFVKFCVMASTSEQFFMIAALDNLALIKNQNLMAVTHGRKSMGHDEAGPLFKQLFQRELDGSLGS